MLLGPSSLSLQLSSPTTLFFKSKEIFNPQLKPENPWLPEHYLRKPMNRMSSSSTRPKKKRALKSESSEAEELVGILMRNFGDERPLVSTLNKYVKMVRTEHCFMLFEELGKRDRWLQCLEVGWYLF
eukprot:TRINITY_DN14407_c0_g4_i4.p1 TRINITY_DN14407_c0_g4~~TRINITY_DN14407_c0_g4_i4.p1  ORF type:complete len:127 (+),score=23.68 TRINITY_DN14407_c0_g4_i4:220-600(+)